MRRMPGQWNMRIDKDKRARSLGVLAGACVAGYLFGLALALTNGVEARDFILPFQVATLKLVIAASIIGGAVEAIVHPILKKYGLATLTFHAIAGGIAPFAIVMAFRMAFGALDNAAAALQFQAVFIFSGAAAGAVYHLVWRRIS